MWAVAKERGFDEDDLREIVRQISGQASTSALTIVDAIKVIDRLEGKTRQEPKESGSQVTTKQLWKLAVLEKELGWADNPKRLEAFIRKYAKVDKPRWLTRYQAIKIIDGLKALLERQNQAI
jgi:hypothetical protein